MHEFFEHTADLGLRIKAATLETLFAEAGEALFAAIVEDPSAIEHRQSHEMRIECNEHELLLFDWLNELLYQFDSHHLLFSTFNVQIDANCLVATAWGEPLDRERHLLSHEVKAITYHGLRVEQLSDGWLAEVIVDI